MLRRRSCVSITGLHRFVCRPDKNRKTGLFPINIKFAAQFSFEFRSSKIQPLSGPCSSQCNRLPLMFCYEPLRNMCCSNLWPGSKVKIE